VEDLNLEVRESRAFKRNMFLVFISVPQSLVLKYRREGEGLSVRIGGGDHACGTTPLDSALVNKNR